MSTSCPLPQQRPSRTPARRPAATPPPTHSAGESSQQIATRGVRAWKANHAAAKARSTAVRKAARKRKPDADPAAVPTPGRPSRCTRSPAAPASNQAGQPGSTVETHPLRYMALEPCHLAAPRGARWQPTRSSMTDSAGDEERAVYGVRYEDTLPLHAYVAPKLAAAFGSCIAKRGGGAPRDLVADDACAASRTRAEGQAWDDSQTLRRSKQKRKQQARGGSVICTGGKESSSGPHKDGTDSLLLASRVAARLATRMGTQVRSLRPV